MFFLQVLLLLLIHSKRQTNTEVSFHTAHGGQPDTKKHWNVLWPLTDKQEGSPLLTHQQGRGASPEYNTDMSPRNRQALLLRTPTSGL